MIFFTAWLTGIMGSFHCAGMCGPLAFATPTLGTTTQAKWWSKIIYHLGRIVTYAIMGFLMGSFGYGIQLAGFQRGIGIGTGILMILIGIWSSKWLENKIGRFWSPLKTSFFQRWMQKKSWPNLIGLGFLQGLLPCGLVYFALIGSIATQSSLKGAIFMSLFGLGTLPMMLSISLIGHWLDKSKRIHWSKMIPIFSVVVGSLFVLRGLSLGIPMISPKIEQNSHQTSIHCCTNSMESNESKKDGCCGENKENCTCNH